jgi:hypothetical protein
MSQSKEPKVFFWHFLAHPPTESFDPGDWFVLGHS